MSDKEFDFSRVVENVFDMIRFDKPLNILWGCFENIMLELININIQKRKFPGAATWSYAESENIHVIDAVAVWAFQTSYRDFWPSEYDRTVLFR